MHAVVQSDEVGTYESEAISPVTLNIAINQARRNVFEIGAANSGEVGFGKGVNFTIIICADPVPGKKTACLQTSVGTFWGYVEM